MVRQPAVAGHFYTDDARRLRSQLMSFVGQGGAGKKALGIMAPHAGYVYSGAVAGAVYGAIQVPETVVILGPNHHGRGARAAVYPAGEWITPLGSVPINSGLAEAMLKNCALLEEDNLAHQYEHSLEVQVPFLQFIRPDVSIVPVCLGFSDFESCRSLGLSLAKSIGEYGKEVLVIASSDMTHYEPANAAKRKDELALQEILALNPEGLYTVVRGAGITMCGFIPTTVMLFDALERGATRSELVSYANSGDVSGDFGQVVGYAAVAVY